MQSATVKLLHAELSKQPLIHSPRVISNSSPVLGAESLQHAPVPMPGQSVISGLKQMVF